MMRRKVPKLAAAFVVTVSAGCGEPTRDPSTPTFTELVRNADGTCSMRVSGNPPYEKPVPCPDFPAGSVSAAAPTSTFASPPGTSTAAPEPTVKSNLPKAPDGWKVERNYKGGCTAYGPDPCNHPGCNPPPPMEVACPADMKEPAKTP